MERSPRINPEKSIRINDEIKVPEVRLIGPDGEQLGIVSNRDAQQKAQDVGLDLIEIAPNASPPVCRITDYKKFLYEKNKASKNKPKKVSVKEVAFRPNTDNHDIEIKVTKVIGFLKAGHKVRITLRYRGREISHQELGVSLMGRLKTEIEAHGGQVEQEPRFEGRQIMMLVGPKRKGS